MEIFTNLKCYNVTSTLNLPFKLMIFRDTKCVFMWNPRVLWTHCIKTVAPIVFKFTHCLQHVCNLLFIVLLYWSCAILVSFSLYLSVISLISAVQLFTPSLHYFPTIIYSSPEILIMNKGKKKCCPPLSQFSPVPFDCLTVQYHVLEHPKPMHLAHTVYCSIQMSYRFAQISPSQIMASIFNTNCVFCPKKIEIPIINMYSVL